MKGQKISESTASLVYAGCAAEAAAGLWAGFHLSYLSLPNRWSNPATFWVFAPSGEMKLGSLVVVQDELLVVAEVVPAKEMAWLSGDGQHTFEHTKCNECATLFEELGDVELVSCSTCPEAWCPQQCAPASAALV